MVDGLTLDKEIAFFLSSRGNARRRVAIEVRILSQARTDIVELSVSIGRPGPVGGWGCILHFVFLTSTTRKRVMALFF